MSAHSIGVANERRAIVLYERLGFQCWKPSSGRWATKDQRDILARGWKKADAIKYEQPIGLKIALDKSLKPRTGADFIAFKPGNPYRFVQVKTKSKDGVSGVPFEVIEDLVDWNEESSVQTQCPDCELPGTMKAAFWDLVVFSKPKNRWRPVVYAEPSDKLFSTLCAVNEIPALSLPGVYAQRNEKRHAGKVTKE